VRKIFVLEVGDSKCFDVCYYRKIFSIFQSRWCKANISIVRAKRNNRKIILVSEEKKYGKCHTFNVESINQKTSSVDHKNFIVKLSLNLNGASSKIYHKWQQSELIFQFENQQEAASFYQYFVDAFS
jgi:hypothetical protein